MAEEIINPFQGLESENQKVSLLTSGVAGIASGIIKIPKGVFSLAAELIDLGFDTNNAASVEQFFDDINPFEEISDQRLSGRLLEGLVQIGVPSTVGAKVATKLAQNALKAKRAGAYANLTGPNLIKATAEAEKLNKLSTTQRYGAIAAGGAVGEAFVADIEKLGTIGEAFGIGPTQLGDIDEETGGREDAITKLMNRFKFGTESLLLAPVVFGIGEGAKKLATQGDALAYSSSKLDRFFYKVGSAFTPQGTKAKKQFIAKEFEDAAKKADAHLAMEQVARIDKEINAMFPDTNKFFNAASDAEKNNFLTTLDNALYSGKLDEAIDKDIVNNIVEAMTKRNMKQESIDTVLTGMDKIRNQYVELINIASRGSGELPTELTTELKTLMGDRLRNTIGNTYAIFDNKFANMYNKFAPAQDKIDKVKQMFIRYGARNGQEISDMQAQSMVNDILEQAKNSFTTIDKMPSFEFGNLTIGSPNKEYIKKTFARTIKEKMAGGEEELKVIGKGSKAFRELFGAAEVNDVRTSIYEGVTKLSAIARRNQMYEDMVINDQVVKANITKDTPLGSRGFFHDSKLKAVDAFGPNVKLVQIDDYVKNDFLGSPVVNALQGKWTTEAIAEGFKNTSKIQDFMRGENLGPLGKTMSWMYRNLILLPKAISQYDKTILTPSTQIKNALTNPLFALSNGTLFESPEVIAQAVKRAGMSSQFTIGSPMSNEQYRKYLRLGMVETGAPKGDLDAILRDVKLSSNGNLGTDSYLTPLVKSLGKAGQLAKKGLNIAETAYITSDNFIKIFNFEVEVARRGRAYAKAGIKKTIDELEEEAAEIVKDTVQNYSRVGEYIKLSRGLPVGNFMSFPSEIFRTSVGIANQILKDLKDPITGSINPITSTNVMKEIAMKRLIGSTTALGVIPYAVIDGINSINGVSDEEAKAASDFVAPWSKDSKKVFMRNSETGALYYMDYSKMNVYDTLQRPFATLLRNIQSGVDKEKPLMDGFIKGVAEAAGGISSPFIEPSIWTEAFADVTFRGGRTPEGKILYTDETPVNERVQRTIMHLAEALAPSYKPFTRTYQAITGTPGKGGETYEVPYEFAGIFGMRAQKIDPLKTMAFYISDYQDSERNSRREFTGGPEGLLTGEIKTPKDLIERYFVANKALFDVQQKMSGHLKNAEALGVSRNNLANLFKTRGLSEETVNELYRNKFNPFFPSEGIIDKFAEISRTTGQPNPFIEAQGTLRSMEREFSRQSLDKKFTPQIQNYIPSLSGNIPPLNTSMPNASLLTPAITQVAGLQNGLTVTENAYLSDSEKQMRLKQRGLA
jgi:hypothetical protein